MEPLYILLREHERDDLDYTPEGADLVDWFTTMDALLQWVDQSDDDLHFSIRAFIIVVVNVDQTVEVLNAMEGYRDYFVIENGAENGRIVGAYYARWFWFEGNTTRTERLFRWKHEPEDFIIGREAFEAGVTALGKVPLKFPDEYRYE